MHHSWMWFVPWPILNLAHGIPEGKNRNIAVVNLFCLRSDASTTTVTPSISYKNPINPIICRRFWPRPRCARFDSPPVRFVLSGSLWTSHSLAITQEEDQHRCQHHVWRSTRTELSQSARGICSSAQLSPTQNVRSHTTCQLDTFIFISFYLTSLHKTFQKQILSAKTRQLVFLHIHSVQPWILRTAGIVHIVHGLRVEHQAYSTTRTCRWQIQKDVPKEPQNRNPELIFQKFRETDQTDIQISCT